VDEVKVCIHMLIELEAFLWLHGFGDDDGLKLMEIPTQIADESTERI
jgi:predicted esterase